MSGSRARLDLDHLTSQLLRAEYGSPTAEMVRARLDRVALLPTRLREPFAPLLTWFELGGLTELTSAPMGRAARCPGFLSEPDGDSDYELTHLELRTPEELEELISQAFAVRFLTLGFALADGLDRLPGLEGLCFLELPPRRLPPLRELHIKVPIDCLPEGSWPDRVEVLGIHGAELGELPRGFPRLRHMDFRLVKCEMSNFAWPATLQSLNLSLTPLREWPDLSHCPNLTDLILSEVCHLQLPRKRCFPFGLRRLRLDYNRLSRLPLWMDELSELQALDLTGNTEHLPLLEADLGELFPEQAAPGPRRLRPAEGEVLARAVSRAKQTKSRVVLASDSELGARPHFPRIASALVAR